LRVSHAERPHPGVLPAAPAGLGARARRDRGSIGREADGPASRDPERPHGRRPRGRRGRDGAVHRFDPIPGLDGAPTHRRYGASGRRRLRTAGRRFRPPAAGVASHAAGGQVLVLSVPLALAGAGIEDRSVQVDLCGRFS
jgi:hypothetical protein